MTDTKFKRGHPKIGGRKKGSKNKAVFKFRDRLEANGVDLEKELAKAILAGNVEMIKALQSLLPYAQPKLKELDSTEQPPQPPETDLSGVSTENLLKLVKGPPQP